MSSGGSDTIPDANKPVHDAGPAECPSGVYTGKLSGNYRAAGGLSNKDVGGMIAFTVDHSGAVSGSYSGPNSATATLSGSMNCATADITIAIQGGTYLLTPAPGSAKFEGTLTAHYDATQQKFVNGSWTMTEPNSAVDGGTGTWIQQ
jgi:hypothetical protein